MLMFKHMAQLCGQNYILEPNGDEFWINCFSITFNHCKSGVDYIHIFNPVGTSSVNLANI